MTTTEEHLRRHDHDIARHARGLGQLSQILHPSAGTPQLYELTSSVPQKVVNNPRETYKSITFLNMSSLSTYIGMMGASPTLGNGYHLTPQSYVTFPFAENVEFEIGSLGEENIIPLIPGQVMRILVIRYNYPQSFTSGLLNQERRPMLAVSGAGPNYGGVIVGTNSIFVCQSGNERKRLVLTNDSTAIIYVNPFGGTAIVGQGLRLNPEGGMYDDEGCSFNAVTAVATAAGSNLCVCEFT
jgi:hypothetical protein